MPLGSGRPCRVCLVTSEFHGLFKNGGIGTANTGLAQTLAQAGHDVTVAYVDQGLVDLDERRAASADVVARWAARGVRLEFVPRHPASRAGHEDHVAASFAVLAFLRGRGFELVYFNECGGQGFYSLLAKRAGLFADAPRMVVVTHGANAWVLELNQQLYWGLHPVSVDFVERRSVELADDLVSPSQYLLRWMQARGWRLPVSTRVIQNALPAVPPPPRPQAPVAEIVFFGRLEARKGVDLFLAAIARLGETRDLSALKIAFLGKFSRIEGVHSGVYVLELTRTWPQPPTLLTELGQEEALAYLSRPGVLAVIPSRAENSPCVVAECLIAGVPFVSTDSGGTAELIAFEDRARTLCPPTAEGLAQTIGAVLEHGARPAALAIPQEEARKAWLELTAEPPPPAPLPRAADVATPVSLCLAPAAPLSAELWAALLAQPFAEIVVAADAAAMLPGDARIRRCDAAGANASEGRNRAAAQARGPWLMFVDERDVWPRADALKILLAAAHRFAAEIVTGPSLELGHAGAPREGYDRFLAHLPVGANLTLAAFENCVGGGCFLIERARFLKTGGFRADAGDALRDRLLLTEAALAGARLEVAPEPLFWRRRAPAGTLAFAETSVDQRRMIAAYAGRPVAELAPALESLVASASRVRERIEAALQGLGGAAREHALLLSRLPQRDGSEQNRPFLEYALMRGRVREALAFAEGAGDGELLALARDGATAAAAKAALSRVLAPAPPETREVPLLRIAAERARPLAGPTAEQIRRELTLSYPARGVGVLKAARLCPPTARRLLARVDAAASVRVALAACDRFALLRLDGETLSGKEPFAWTGWRAPGELVLDLPCFDAPGDILLLSEGRSTEPVVWSALAVEMALADFASASGVEVAPGVAPLPPRLLAAAELLTSAPDFPGPYFVAGAPSTHHPLVGRPALVRLAHAAFQGAKAVRATFALEHEKSRPVAFALWARPQGTPACDARTLGEAAPFSGWRVVRAAFQEHSAEIVFPEPLAIPHDLYLATKVVDFADNNYCHAVWREIVVVES